MKNTLQGSSATKDVLLEKRPVNSPVARSVQLWLLTGVILVFVQVIIGGVTRLTDSGLSITEWAVIQGTIPPLNQAEWQEAFELYKIAAKKQYETLHADMTLSAFKWIYFWEYLHRLWARMTGLVFLFPFLYFLSQKMLPKWLLQRLGIVIALAVVVATFGWIMVASGLNNDQRTWVSAYKLVGHLTLATILFSYLLWTWFLSLRHEREEAPLASFKKLGWAIIGLTGLQIIFGGLMAGMRAGLVHPYFPFFVEGDRLLAALQSFNGDMINYEASARVKAIVQLLHRGMAYVLTGIIVYFHLQLRKYNLSAAMRRGNNLLLLMIITQFVLGVLTVINCFGKVPIAYGAMHQAGALVLLGIMLFITQRLTTFR